MIDYSKIKEGDKLMIVGMGARRGSLPSEMLSKSSPPTGRTVATVKRADGETAYFALTCGAERLKQIDA